MCHCGRCPLVSWGAEQPFYLYGEREIHARRTVSHLQRTLIMAGLVTYVLLLSVIAAVFGAVYSSPERKRRTEQWLNDKFENL